MLASSDIVEATATAIEAADIAQLVVDPVFVSKHGNALLESEAVEALKTKLFPLATVITPNLHEAAALTGLGIETKADMLTAARALHAMGPGAVLVKGGHAEGDDAVDLLWDGTEAFELNGPRYDTRDTHGTGCALSAAIAARLAHGDNLRAAVVFAKEFISGAIKHSLRLGGGFGPVNPGWRL
jgi:hydroxymethylpyrimidine/phosphomethylpyrimidine kinase